MDEVFSRGAVFRPGRADQPVILGLRLQPLTLGHQLLLLSIGSPFVHPTAACELRDFFTAIFICAQPWARADRALRAWWLPLFFKLWFHLTRRRQFIQELSVFRQWFAAQTATPAFKQSGGEAPARSCGAPTLWVRYLFCLRECGLTREQARDLTVIESSALYATWADWEGRAELVGGPRNRALLAFAREQDAKRFNEDGTRKSAGSREVGEGSEGRN